MTQSSRNPHRVCKIGLAVLIHGEADVFVLLKLACLVGVIVDMSGTMKRRSSSYYAVIGGLAMKNEDVWIFVIVIGVA